MAHSLGSNLPSVNFPALDGLNQKMWKKRRETLSSFYSVPVEMWVRLATLHFDGPAMFWLWSMDNRVLSMSWD